METATQATDKTQETTVTAAPHLRALLAARPDKELRALGEKHGVWQAEQTREALVTALVGALRSQEISAPASGSQTAMHEETKLDSEASPHQEVEASAGKPAAKDKQEEEPAIIEDKTNSANEVRTSGASAKDEKQTKQAAEEAGLKELQGEVPAVETGKSAPTSAKKAKTPITTTKRSTAAATLPHARLAHKTKVPSSSASAVKVAVVKNRSASARKPTKAGDFSFARPTESSTSRCRASAEAHAKATLALRSTPSKKPTQAKTLSGRAAPGANAKSTTTPKKTSSGFNYTPYSGPLPPYNVESSFAPKTTQQLSRPAYKSTLRIRTPKKQSSRPTGAGSSGKENNGAEPSSGADQQSTKTPTSAARRVPVKKSSATPSASKESARAAFQEKSKAQRALAQDAARSTEEVGAETSS